MKTANIYLFIAALCIPLLPLKAQRGVNNIKVESTEVTRENGIATLNMLLNLDAIDLKSQEMLYLFPVLVSPDSINEYSFNPVVVTGAKRGKALERMIKYDNFTFEKTPQIIIPYKKRNDQLYPLKLTVNYQDWLQNASLVFYEDVTGCNCRNEYSNRYTVLSPILPPIPNYQMSYMLAANDGIRSEKYNAHINFKVAKYDILPNFKNNAEVLEEVNKVIREINNNPNLTVQEFKITGYASPEGTPPYNMNLSKNRAESFVTYLRNKHSIPAEKIQTDWKGEDWDGLRELVEKSSLNDRNEILEIIANEPDLRRRENKIKQLSGGRTYRTLLNDYYPGLRRNEYMISYASKDFNVREARQLIRTNPEKLRLQDMYMLAHTYPQNSQEFRDVILTAAKYYPEDQTVLVNTAIYNIESGKVDDAIKTLERVNTPEAWNNLGIAYFHKQDYQRAKQYFDMAARAGLECASVNARELSKYLGNSSR